MKKLIFGIGMAAMCALGSGYYFFYHQFTSIESIDEIIPLAQRSSPENIWMFNIDAITYPVDELCQNFTNDTMRRTVHFAHPQLIRPSDAEEYTSLILDQSPQKVVDESMIELLAMLKQQNIPHLGIGKLYRKGYGCIEKTDEWRHKKLCEAGINFFHPAFPAELIFASFEPFKHDHERYFKGLLLSNDGNFGKIVGHYLDVMVPRPSKIFYTSADPRELDEVRTAALKRGVEFVGIHYRGTRKHYSKEPQSDRIVLQLKHLIEHRVWLSDEQASSLLYQKNILSSSNEQSAHDNLFPAQPPQP